MTPSELFEAGKLGEAVTSLVADVKRHPTDRALRGFLAELFCFTGDLERADKQLDALGEQDPTSMVGVALFRQLIRGEQARQQFYAEGRLPDFLDAPTPAMRLHLEASIQLREGQPAEAARLLSEAEAARPAIGGECDGRAFTVLRDLDDLTASFFEVLTSTGKYYWIPFEKVEHVEFHPPQRPRDLLWRRASMSCRGGPEGDVYVPALYVASHADADERVRLGRYTDWSGGDGAPVRGRGQRTLLIGDDDRSLMEIANLTIR